MKQTGGMILRTALAFSVILLTCGVTRAQYVETFQAPYKTALGIRVGGTSGVTLKHFYRSQMSMEGIIGTFGNGFSLTGLVEKNARVFDAKGLNWYYGGGAHVAFYNGNRYYRLSGRDVIYRENHDVGVGVNGIIGMEYTFPDDIPVAISLDLKPFLEVDGDGDVGVAPDLALGLKFLIK